MNTEELSSDELDSVSGGDPVTSTLEDALEIGEVVGVIVAGIAGWADSLINEGAMQTVAKA